MARKRPPTDRSTAFTADGIQIGVCEEDLAGRPPVPPVQFVMPPDTPPDVLEAIRQADEETKAWLAAQKAG